MRPSLSRSLIRVAATLLLAGLAAATLAVGAYFLTFAPASNYHLSATDGAWSNFGSYLGGVLGPLFSFLAFVGVLFTVWLQAKQLEDSKSRAHLDELQRVQAIVAKNIDDLLAQPPAAIVQFANLGGSGLTVFSVLSAAGTAALMPKSGPMVAATQEMTVKAAKESISLKVGAILVELHQLVWCLQEYEGMDGSPAVATFYRKRYEAIVCWLDVLGFCESHARVQSYFQPRELRQYLVP